ncbi:MAG: hypothetical protein JKY81_08240 [Colwellia sp.]|nr:hypothetical protein [Colwellia sp.]
MFSLIVKLSIALKPFHRLTYLLALLIIVNLAYKFLFSSEPIQATDKAAMFSLLALAWLVLINLMLQVFTRIPERIQTKQSFFVRIKNRLHQAVYYVLSLLFIGLSLTLIILSIRMLRL